MFFKLDAGNVSYHRRVQNYCLLPYPGCPGGCDRRGTFRSLEGFPLEYRPRLLRECPPTVEQLKAGAEKLLMIDEIFDFSRQMFAIWTVFELGLDAQERFERTGQDYPTRKPEHCYNKLWWQPRARKQLRQEVIAFLDAEPRSIADLCPEAHGTNLDSTMAAIGVQLPWYDVWPPKHSLDNKVIYVAMGGFALDEMLLREKGMLGRSS